jgi:hypothetical protein
MSKKDLHFPKNREHEINNSLPGDSTELLNAAIKQL